MPEQVARARLARVRTTDLPAYQLGEPRGAERLALLGEKEHALVGRHHELGSGLVDVPSQPQDGPLSDGHDAIFLPLALPDDERASVGVEVVEPQADGLVPASTKTTSRASRSGQVREGDRRRAQGHSGRCAHLMRP